MISVLLLYFPLLDRVASVGHPEALLPKLLLQILL
jgi:hypothetical protein